MGAIGVLNFAVDMQTLKNLPTLTSLLNNYYLCIIYVVTNAERFEERHRFVQKPQPVPGFGNTEGLTDEQVKLLKGIKFYKTEIPFGVPQNMFAVADAVKDKAAGQDG